MHIDKKFYLTGLKGRPSRYCNLVHCTQVINTDQKIGWTGFLPYWYRNSTISRALLFLGLRQSLWNWIMAAFPSATFCLASATLTDSAVEDIKSIYQLAFNYCSVSLKHH